MLAFIIVIGISFLLQGLMSFMQMKNFSDEFIKLRRKGKVACGRKSGGLRAGAIVMFGIDDDGIITEARKLEGVTALQIYSGRGHRGYSGVRPAAAGGRRGREPARQVQTESGCPLNEEDCARLRSRGQ